MTTENTMKKFAMLLVCLAPVLPAAQQTDSSANDYAAAVRAEQQYRQAESMLAAITTKNVDVKQLVSLLAKLQRDTRGREAIERARLAIGA